MKEAKINMERGHGPGPNMLASVPLTWRFGIERPRDYFDVIDGGAAETRGEPWAARDGGAVSRKPTRLCLGV